MSASAILAVNVQGLRSERQLTRAALAIALGWSPDRVKALEEGRFDAALSDIDTLSAFFGVHPLALMQEPQAQSLAAE